MNPRTTQNVALLEAALLAYENPAMASPYGPATFEDQAFRIGHSVKIHGLPKPVMIRQSVKKIRGETRHLIP